VRERHVGQEGPAARACVAAEAPALGLPKTMRFISLQLRHSSTKSPDHRVTIRPRAYCLTLVQVEV